MLTNLRTHPVDALSSATLASQPLSYLYFRIPHISQSLAQQLEARNPNHEPHDEDNIDNDDDDYYKEIRRLGYDELEECF